MIMYTRGTGDNRDTHRQFPSKSTSVSQTLRVSCPLLLLTHLRVDALGASGTALAASRRSTVDRILFASRSARGCSENVRDTYDVLGANLLFIVIVIIFEVVIVGLVVDRTRDGLK
jgi:hypothetical protein